MWQAYVVVAVVCSYAIRCWLCQGFSGERQVLTKFVVFGWRSGLLGAAGAAGAADVLGQHGHEGVGEFGVGEVGVGQVGVGQVGFA